MAVRIEINCKVCGETKSESVSSVILHKQICNACEKIANDIKRDKYLQDLKELSMEERVANIEARLYDQDQNPPWKRYDQRRF